MKTRMALALLPLFLSVSPLALAQENDPPSPPVHFVPAEAWRGEDGTVCNFSEYSERFLSCVVVQYYDVGGRTRGDLLSQLDKSGPKESHAVTMTQVEWGEDKDGNCMIAISSTIHLPRHSDEDAMPPELKKYWVTTLAALEEHERQHHRFAVWEAWREFRNNCQTVEGLADRIDALNVQYDLETKNGELEGARFQ